MRGRSDAGIARELERRERARIHERHAIAVRERDDDAREARHFVADAAHFPLAVQAKVHDQHAAAIEADDLMLPAARHAEHDAARERTGGRGRQAPRECRVRHRYAGDRRAFQRGAQLCGGRFDLGELGHS